mmetsp:Transcript_11664/g.28312  ORF Transcript_11664/g.28312 Transcript_11664/m.28312 type:complete len:626 (+) Transcript_11664:62-1939(+)
MKAAASYQRLGALLYKVPYQKFPTQHRINDGGVARWMLGGFANCMVAPHSKFMSSRAMVRWLSSGMRNHSVTFATIAELKSNDEVTPRTKQALKDLEVDERTAQFVDCLNGAVSWKSTDDEIIAQDDLSKVELYQKLSQRFEDILDHLCNKNNEKVESVNPDNAHELLSSENVDYAFLILSSCDYDARQLSKKVRAWEKFIGQLRWTTLTDELSLRLLISNAKAANVGRVLSILQLRKDRGFEPCDEEFIYAIQSLKIASASQHADGVRNIFVHDADQPAVDNPTRWLDSILLNMSKRGYPLTTSLANRMLDCYGAGGRSGKAVHHFYRVVRKGILDMPPEEQPSLTDEMPKDWVYSADSGNFSYQPIKVKVKYHEGAPPFYKVPSQVAGKRLHSADSSIGKLKVERELEPEYSIPLAAAFAFADSLQHGACGHKAIRLDVGSYNALIKASVWRGALWRAMHVLDTIMPAAGISPNQRSFNSILLGLAAVGDVVTAQEIYLKMHNFGLEPDETTVHAIVDGLLNAGDSHGSITVVQDFFNQHSVLPPLWMHYKILELCLGQGLAYEAKRYVYFIQQLWKWEPNQYHDPKFVETMRAVQKSPGLQKEALQKLFAYFGEELKDSDFF